MEESQKQDEERTVDYSQPIFGPLPTVGAVQRSLEFDDIRKINNFNFEALSNIKLLIIIITYYL